MKNFIVVGTQRTGSSAVAESIGLHPLVTCGWEWTLGLSRRSKLAVIERALQENFSALSKADQAHMAETHNRNKEWVGFRWLFSSSDKWLVHPRLAPALWFDSLEKFITWARLHPQIHIIHVIRQNNLDWLKSLFLAKKAMLYSKKSYPDGLRVKVPISAARRRVHSKTWVDSRLGTLQFSNPYLCVFYEDFLADAVNSTGRTLSFLNCGVHGVKLQERRLHKQSKAGIVDYLTNLADLQKELSKYDLL